MELKREDDVILILTEFADKALGLAKLGRKGTGRNEGQNPRNWHKKVNKSEGRGKM